MPWMRSQQRRSPANQSVYTQANPQQSTRMISYCGRCIHLVALHAVSRSRYTCKQCAICAPLKFLYIPCRHAHCFTGRSLCFHAQTRELGCVKDVSLSHTDTSWTRLDSAAFTSQRVCNFGADAWGDVPTKLFQPGLTTVNILHSIGHVSRRRWKLGLCAPHAVGTTPRKFWDAVAIATSE